ncbi:hypothetical protein CCR94_12615 [Rhodoblastus sphagnicola]|uniref:Uncharacterized protein n=1 Tax=Rhodoblastus sphagnicola TaxID=333368 RepID=A0A2S6N6Z6_9HYPH|nr:host nuclease inhibitor protein [Rhodoblastus sphagnicola]MBB4200755.1 hypothetical protein [Rhodoblastus sphagnicola]PPQ30374.1 hypothetical protein CCR94_12615 [Rhodoblastus sphagnicola]
MTHIAFANRAGVIGFGRRCPAGALPIAQHDDRDLLKSKVSVVALLAHDNKTLLVPGVPEAEDGDQALSALTKFAERIRSRLREASA